MTLSGIQDRFFQVNFLYYINMRRILTNSNQKHSLNSAQDWNGKQSSCFNEKKINSPSFSEPIWDGFEMSYGNGVGSLLRNFILA